MTRNRMVNGTTMISTSIKRRFFLLSGGPWIPIVVWDDVSAW